MVTINNLYYFGVTQALPGMLGILFLRRMRPSAIIAGIIAGDVVSVAIYQFAVPVGGLNAGFIGLMVNLLIVFGALRFLPGQDRIPIAERTGRQPLEPALPGP
jgi:SSS family solute:Na+ symporter